MKNTPTHKLWQVFKSVSGSFLGVQKSTVAEHDFAQSALWPYLVVGVFFLLVFVGALILVVRSVV